MNENTATAAATAETRPARGPFRPKLTFYHANAKGTGAAAEFELHPAHDDVDGSVFMTLANQKSIGSREGASRVFPTFDWQHRLCVKLDISDISQMLQVFRGMSESIADGKGLFHRSAKSTAVIGLEHRIDQAPGYRLDVSVKPLDGGEPRRAGITFTNNEALSLALEHSMSVIAFGIPMIFPRAATNAGPGAAADVEEDMPW